MKCDSIYSDCIGGSSENLCNRGYVGALCRECDYENNYGRDVYKKCTFCENYEWPYFQIIGNLIGLLGYFTISIYFVANDAIV